MYEGRHQSFVHKPASLLDEKCSQEATALGCLWLDVFNSVTDEADFTDGVGTTKYDEDEVFRIMREADMTLPLRPSAVATYLHDSTPGADGDSDGYGSGNGQAW